MESGRALQGFTRSERRRTWGGECWRKLEPHQEGREWWMGGREYESWEASGGASAGLINLLPDQEHRASRVDIAFDLTCSAECMSDHIAEACAPVALGRGLSLGISGQDGIHTRYIGAASSDKRIRIYRRDLKQPELWDFPSPVMRVEVVLKGEWAASWVKVYQSDQASAFGTAARVVHDMSGLRVWHVGCALELQRDPVGDEVAELFQACKTSAAAFERYSLLGVDFPGLCRLMFQSMGRVTKSRVGSAVRAGHAVDWRAVEEAVSSAIARRGLPA